jgi:hypothetical protein
MADKRNSVTEDIKPSWLNPVRAAQAACRNNKGFASVHFTLLVDKNNPVAWGEPKLVKIHPARLSQYNISPMLLGALLEMMEPEVDNNQSGT